jgi:aspartyl-tRNA(Asn)/glutamyl-tRNA(Gln) amidotransferase subunit A
MSLPPDTAFSTIPELGLALRERRVTSVELTEFFLTRLETTGRQLNSVVTLLKDRALEEARRADDELRAGKLRGPLHGIPYGVKDLLSAVGGPTTWGCEIYKDRVIPEDAAVVQRLSASGAVLVAKLAMVELAGGLGYRQASATFTGPGLNPWDRTRWAGGSSCGSGAAVAAGLVPFAIGSETWGSIITPASYCGVSGLRPTYGRVSRHGAMALSWSMDKLGPLARTANDCALVLAAISGRDSRDATTLSETFAWPSSSMSPGSEPRRFRFAVVKDAARFVQPGVRTRFEASVEVARQLGTVDEIELPRHPFAAVAQTIIASECAAAFGELLANGQVARMTAPEDRIGLHAAMHIPAVDYINACRIRGRAAPELDASVRPFDAVLTPTTSTVASPIDREFNEYSGAFRGTPLGAAANVVGMPGLSIPNGEGEAGLPTGLMLTGAVGTELQLLEAAAAIQRRTSHHARRPPA